ncbi:MAG: ribonuclease HII [Spirochaetes bacterium]|nr:ribonuclease HII [Spirochaetota bacterium]
MPDFEIEKELLSNGCEFVAGIDEAGRGSLAGPLSVSMVVFPKEIILNTPFDFKCINDSKKLKPAIRERVFDFIKNHAFTCEHVFIDHQIIDEINVNQATRLAVQKLIQNVQTKPDYLLIDGNFSFKFEIPSLSVKKGDSKSFSIAAASIMAKVIRDREMLQLSSTYSSYGFDRNMGYGTKDHMEALRIHGASPVHRLSYAPCRK